MNPIEPGSHVLARSASGELLERRAITGPVAGEDFRVVWVCRDEEWEEARADGREPDGIPWPAGDVKAAEHVRA
jgi:hypothetical protein